MLFGGLVMERNDQVMKFCEYFVVDFDLTWRSLLARSAALVLFGLSFGSTHAQIATHASPSHVIALDPAQPTIDISTRFSIFRDTTHTKSIADVLLIPDSELERPRTMLKTSSNATTYWLKFTIKPEKSGPTPWANEWFLDVEPPWMDDVSLFTPGTSGGFTEKRTGDQHRFDTRDTAHSSFAFHLKPAASEQTHWLRIRSSGTVWVRATLVQPQPFIKSATQYAYVHGITVGVLLLLLLLVTLQGIALRDPYYALFAGYVATVLVALIAGNGVMARFVAPGLPWFGDILAPSSACLSISAYALFCRYFLFGDVRSLVLRRFLLGTVGLGLIGAVLTAIPNLRAAFPFFLGVKIVCAVVVAVVAAPRLLKGDWAGGLLWLGVLVNIVAQAMLLSSLSSLRVSEDWLSTHGYVAPVLLHVLLLSVALSQRARRLSRERHTLKSELLSAERVQQATQTIADDQRSFLSMVAHELRSPLAAARSANHNLGELAKRHNAADMSPRVARIDNSIAQMSALIDVCLVHERDPSGWALSVSQVVGVGAWMAQTNALLDEATNARVRWPHAESMPALSVVGNAALLAIALRNLIENACRYDETGQKVDITVGVTEPEDDDQAQQLQISVLDHGRGVPPGESSHVFTAFARGSAATGDNSGLGLGLYIVQRICVMHGATATCEPRVGGGAVFTLTLRGQKRESPRRE